VVARDWKQLYFKKFVTRDHIHDYSMVIQRLMLCSVMGVTNVVNWRIHHKKENHNQGIGIYHCI